MSQLQPPRGMHDLLPDDTRKHRYVIDAARSIAENYGFAEIQTPFLEFTEVFARTLGDASDIVTKEMYTFVDRSGDQLTLRPEGTAGVARAFITHSLSRQIPLKYYYCGPLFRHERPQKGRQRQYHTFGIETLGVAGPLADVETIALGHHFVKTLGKLDKVTIQLNTLGDTESRQKFRQILVDYFNDVRTELSEDSQQRLERNPLRILDSKAPQDQPIIQKAPTLSEHLNAYSKEFFAAVCESLNQLNIAFTLNPKLVRGLDYYSHTVFEFLASDLGAQNAVLSGGRYDGLVELMGGPNTPGVGWGAGVERLVLLLQDNDVPKPTRPILIVPVGDAAEKEALNLTQQLRHAGFYTELGYSGNVGKRMKAANKFNARWGVIFGDQEIQQGIVQLKDLDSGTQQNISRSEIFTKLREL